MEVVRRKHLLTVGEWSQNPLFGYLSSGGLVGWEV